MHPSLREAVPSPSAPITRTAGKAGMLRFAVAIQGSVKSWNTQYPMVRRVVINAFASFQRERREYCAKITPKPARAFPVQSTSSKGGLLPGAGGAHHQT